MLPLVQRLPPLASSLAIIVSFIISLHARRLVPPAALVYLPYEYYYSITVLLCQQENTLQCDFFIKKEAGALRPGLCKNLRLRLADPPFNGIRRHIHFFRNFVDCQPVQQPHTEHHPIAQVKDPLVDQPLPCAARQVIALRKLSCRHGAPDAAASSPASAASPAAMAATSARTSTAPRRHAPSAQAHTSRASASAITARRRRPIVRSFAAQAASSATKGTMRMPPSLIVRICIVRVPHFGQAGHARQQREHARQQRRACDHRPVDFRHDGGGADRRDSRLRHSLDRAHRGGLDPAFPVAFLRHFLALLMMIVVFALVVNPCAQKLQRLCHLSVASLLLEAAQGRVRSAHDYVDVPALRPVVLFEALDARHQLAHAIADAHAVRQHAEQRAGQPPVILEGFDHPCSFSLPLFGVDDFFERADARLKGVQPCGRRVLLLPYKIRCRHIARLRPRADLEPPGRLRQHVHDGADGHGGQARAAYACGGAQVDRFAACGRDGRAVEYVHRLFLLCFAVRIAPGRRPVAPCVAAQILMQNAPLRAFGVDKRPIAKIEARVAHAAAARRTAIQKAGLAARERCDIARARPDAGAPLIRRAGREGHARRPRAGLCQLRAIPANFAVPLRADAHDLGAILRVLVGLLQAALEAANPARSAINIAVAEHGKCPVDGCFLEFGQRRFLPSCHSISSLYCASVSRPSAYRVSILSRSSSSKPLATMRLSTMYSIFYTSISLSMARASSEFT
nr:MAG TPA: hypothetical protein [Caudoviricetes sp.]